MIGIVTDKAAHVVCALGINSTVIGGIDNPALIFADYAAKIRSTLRVILYVQRNISFNVFYQAGAGVVADNTADVFLAVDFACVAQSLRRLLYGAFVVANQAAYVFNACDYRHKAVIQVLQY